MDINLFDSLTPSERTILRALLTERDQKTVARNLGLSPETVKSHLRNAREKCGANTSFALARAFALHERRPPEWGITPDGGGAVVVQGGIDTEPTQTETDDERYDEARETRCSFIFDESHVPFVSARQPGKVLNGTTLRRLFVIVALVALLMLLMILAFPLSESFQRLANLIDPPTL